jgi:hypothetical protein
VVAASTKVKQKYMSLHVAAFEIRYDNRMNAYIFGNCRMLKAVYLAIAVLLLLGSESWGQSQEPPRQNAESAQQRPDSNQRGTEQSPFIIQIQPTAQEQEKSKSNRADGPNEWLYGWTLYEGMMLTPPIPSHANEPGVVPGVIFAVCEKGNDAN